MNDRDRITVIVVGTHRTAWQALAHTATGRASFSDAGEGRPVQAVIASAGSNRWLWAAGAATLVALGPLTLAVRKRRPNTTS